MSKYNFLQADLDAEEPFVEFPRPDKESAQIDKFCYCDKIKFKHFKGKCRSLPSSRMTDKGLTNIGKRDHED